MLGLHKDLKDGNYKVGNGSFIYKSVSPAVFCLTKESAESYRSWIKEQLSHWNYSNNQMVKRGPYIIASVMKESITDEPLVLKGSFADILTKDFKLLTEKIINPGENTLLYDLSCLKDDGQIIGTSARINKLTVNDKYIIECHAAEGVNVYIRIYCKRPLLKMTGIDNIKVEYDNKTSTALISFVGNSKDVILKEA